MGAILGIIAAIIIVTAPAIVWIWVFHNLPDEYK